MAATRSATWRAMGTDVHVVVVGGTDRHVETARRRLDGLEDRWSRFRACSDVTRLNAAGGRPVRVAAETRRLVELAVAGWHRTAGRFDPTVLSALEAAGYDRPFGAGLDRAEPAAEAGPAPGCAGIVVEPEREHVTLPAGVRIDVGGIAKGHAADLVARELLDAGAAGALVNVGGDLRAVGAGPRGHGWTVGIDHAPGSALVVTNGGVATSATTQRRWSRAGCAQHHVIDPTTGRPARATPDAVTVFAATAADAEIVATAAILAGRRAVEVITAAGASGFALAPGGNVDATPDLRNIAAARPRGLTPPADPTARARPRGRAATATGIAPARPSRGA